jgi:superfamily II DNA or RNA helicase
MSGASPDLKIGQKVTHPELGDGVITALDPGGFLTVFFRAHGERRVPPASVASATTWIERVAGGLRPATPDLIERLWLAVEAAELPFMESAATLTSAKVDLLPHQVVLVHRIANATPRRFLIADEVGLGKTIETALILRELASRGEMTRALMVVPAGLVDNWRRELNEVFNLDFEVFGYEGDITDRRSNAFAKHNRVIVSVDTLKRAQRVRRLLEAPAWDLIVFDEAHHLSVYKAGKKIQKTQNFKLAEAAREHCRDLILLSATPHQGDHFRFWMLLRLLHPALFTDENDMVENRHRLNAVVVRRTKADACAPDGGPLFARRMVHTEGFTLSESERAFYDELLAYLREGYNLAAQQGGKGRAIGFVMTIFQKIAASSFAAIRSTLQRRLLMLTIQEAVERDELLDVRERDALLRDAIEQIHQIHNLAHDAVGRAEAERLLADTKYQLLKKRKSLEEFVTSAESYSDTEIAAAAGEESAAMIVTVALPEERLRIRKLLEHFPKGPETKTQVLLNALDQLWKISANEKVVIFTTYLGGISSIHDAIEARFPAKGVEVLKGGDQGAKLAAQRRFKRSDGPRVLLCTAAGREGINLQFARILFNHDLPWNPMDLEQRIGRIHRYGQQDTAQVYNLVAADTIEGQIFLLLEEKLHDIAEALGKVDEQGQIAEDLRSQVLGQLGERLSYDKLYKDAVSDPTLRRTRQELEVAMSNASLARRVVFELFQDLEGFNLNDYEQFDDKGQGMARLVSFVQHAARLDGAELKPVAPGTYEFSRDGAMKITFTTDRDAAIQRDDLELLGLEHPTVKELMDKRIALAPEDRALAVRLDGPLRQTGIITIWQVVVHGPAGQVQQRIVRIGITPEGERSPALERAAKDLKAIQPTSASGAIPRDHLASLMHKATTEILHRELVHAGLLREDATYSSNLLACMEIV